MIGVLRLAAAAVIISSVIWLLYRSGPVYLLYFTIQSNLLGIAVLAFGGITALTGGKLAACPRLSFIATFSLLMTMLMFWGIIAPSVEFELVTFVNITQHLFAPLVVILDRVLFYTGCAPTKKGALIALIHPILFFIQAMIVGAAKLVEFPDGTRWFPYPFLDFYEHGMMMPVFIIVIALFMILSASLMAWWERRRDKKLVMRALTRGP